LGEELRIIQGEDFRII